MRKETSCQLVLETLHIKVVDDAISLKVHAVPDTRKEAIAQTRAR